MNNPNSALLFHVIPFLFVPQRLVSCGLFCKLHLVFTWYMSNGLTLK